MALTINTIKEISELVSSNDFDILKYKEILNKSSDFKAGAVPPPPPPPMAKVGNGPLPPPPPPMAAKGKNPAHVDIQESLFEIFNHLKSKENFKTVLDDILTGYITDILLNGCLYNGSNNDDLKLEIMKNIKNDVIYFLKNGIDEGLSSIHKFVNKFKNSQNGLEEINKSIKKIIQDHLDEHFKSTLEKDPLFNEYKSYKSKFLDLSNSLNKIKMELTPDKYHMLKNLDGYKHLEEIYNIIKNLDSNLTATTALKREYEKSYKSSKERVSEKLNALKNEIREITQQERQEQEKYLSENAPTHEGIISSTTIALLRNHKQQAISELKEIGSKEADNVNEDEFNLLRKIVVQFSKGNIEEKKEWLRLLTESSKKLFGCPILEFPKIKLFMQQCADIIKTNDTLGNKISAFKRFSKELSVNNINFYELLIEAAIQKNDSKFEIKSEKYLNRKVSSLDEQINTLRIYNNVFSHDKPKKGEYTPGVNKFGRLALNIIPFEKPALNHIGKVIKEKSNLVGLIVEMKVMDKSGEVVNNYYYVMNNNDEISNDLLLMYNGKRVNFVTEAQLNKISEDNGFPLKSYHLYLDNLNDSQIENLYFFGFNSILERDVKSRREAVQSQYSEMVRRSEITMENIMQVALGYHIRPTELFLKIGQLRNEGFIFDFENLKKDFFNKNVILKQALQSNDDKQIRHLIGLEVAPRNDGEKIAESIEKRTQVDERNRFSNKLNQLKTVMLPELREFDGEAKILGDFEASIQSIEEIWDKLPTIESPIVGILKTNPDPEDDVKLLVNAYAQSVSIKATLASLEEKVDSLIKQMSREIEVKKAAQKEEAEANNDQGQAERDHRIENIRRDLEQDYPGIAPELLDRLALLQYQSTLAQQNVGLVQGQVNHDEMIRIRNEYTAEIEKLKRELDENKKLQVPNHVDNEEIARREAAQRERANALEEEQRALIRQREEDAAQRRAQADMLRQLQIELEAARRQQEILAAAPQQAPETPEAVYTRTRDPRATVQQAAILNLFDNSNYMKKLANFVKNTERSNRGVALQKYNEINKVISEYRR